MNNFREIAAAAVFLAVAYLVINSSWKSGTKYRGEILYMDNGAGAVEQAKFVYPGDCAVVAKAIGAAEKAQWYCQPQKKD